MAKFNVLDNPAYKTAPSKGAGFNLVTQVNNFTSVFNTKPLDESDANKIEKLLVENFQPGTIEEEQVEQDMCQMKQLTAEIKSIGKQGVVLMGERGHTAKEILKPYKDGTFSKWLESAFGTRKTGYNALAYFTFHKSLPSDQLKENFKKFPLRAAYALASREGDVETKTAIVRECHDLDHNDIVSMIQEKLPADIEDKRKTKGTRLGLTEQVAEILKKIQKRKDTLSDRERERETSCSKRDHRRHFKVVCNSYTFNKQRYFPYV